MGLPFFKLWRDEAEEEDGVAGTWGSIVGVAEAASRNAGRGRRSKKAPPAQPARFGLLKSGAWGQLPAGGPSVGESHGDGEEGFREPSFDFPLVLLDVDDTLPPFVSVAEEADEEEWDRDDSH